MKYVSPAYQQSIQLHRTQGIRNQMHAKINFGVIDQYAFDDASFSISPGVSFSDTSGIETGINDVTESYASWEQNFWQLTGQQRFLNVSNPYDTGYISNEISNGSGIFMSNPSINVSFSNPHDMVGITIQFDTVNGTCPSDFTISAYNTGSLLNTWTVSDNTDVIYQGELGIENADQIVITFIKANPYNRIRINSLLFGIAYSYSDNDIISITHNKSVSPVSLELPSESLNFTLFNEDGKYDLNSNFSLIPFLQKEQSVSIQYGYDVTGTGDIEWLEQDTYLLESWETDGINATFTCKDIFNKLSASTYVKGVFDGQNHSASSLAQSVLTDAGISDFWVNDVMLQSISTNLPLICDSHGANLQLIANLGLSSLEQDENGGVVYRYREEPDQSTMTADPSQIPQTDYSYYYSQSNVTGGVFDQIEVPDYATWEQDFFALDGSMAFLPESSPYQNVGYVSDVFPDEDGNYPESSVRFGPTITLDFGGNITFGELEIDIGNTSQLTAFKISGQRETSQSNAESPVYETIFSEDNVPVVFENGKICFTQNFDRIAIINITCISNSKNQRPRIKRVIVNYVLPFYIDSSDIIGNPKSELLARCNQVTLNGTKVVASTSQPTDPVQTITVSPNVLTEIKHSDAYYNCKFECSNPSVVIQQEIHYAFVSYIQISGVSQDVEVELYANTYSSETTVPYTETLNTIGDPVVVDNPIFPANSAQGQQAIDWISDYLQKRYEHTVETLGYPEVEPGDIIYYKNKEATVIEANINFNQGAMRETFILRGEEKLNGVANT